MLRNLSINKPDFVTPAGLGIYFLSFVIFAAVLLRIWLKPGRADRADEQVVSSQ